MAGTQYRTVEGLVSNMPLLYIEIVTAARVNSATDVVKKHQ